MSTHSLSCTLTFSQQYEVTYEEKDIYIIKPPFSANKTASHSLLFLVTSGQNVKRFLKDLC